MRNALRMTMTGVVAMSLGLGLPGCSDEASEKTQTTTKGFDGSQTKVTTETKVEKSGDNPPAPAHP